LEGQRQACLVAAIIAIREAETANQAFQDNVPVSRYAEFQIITAAAECLRLEGFCGDPNSNDFTGTPYSVAKLVWYALAHEKFNGSSAPNPEFFPFFMATQGAMCHLLRHIIGNPFRPYPAPPSWPTAVVALAEAIYNGADATFALHDALLEAGHPDLATHFHAEKEHPKGCWVVDLVLGKE
jgi:hypothetical protein